MKKKRIVITGLGVVAPNAINTHEFKESLWHGKSGIRNFEDSKNLNCRCQIAGVPPISTELIKEKLPKLLSSTLSNNGIIYALLAGLEAWQMAGLAISDDRKKNVGLVFGTGASSSDVFSKEVYRKINAGESAKLGSTIVPQSMNSGPAAYLNQVFGIGGPIIANSSACATGSESILLGFDIIQSGKSEIVLCGSTEGIGRYLWGPFDSMRILCANSNENPELGSRPMHANSTGFVPSGGAGAMVLESLESAERRQAPVYAELLGGAQNSGGMRQGGSMTAPNPIAAEECIRQAIISSGVDVKDIDLISGHLTSTKADPLEISIWKNALGLDSNTFPLINTPKSMIGHCISAAGSIESIACVLQIYHGFVHKNLNLTSDTIHPEIASSISTEKVVLQTKKLPVNVVIKSNFGFGDVNCCLVFKKFEK